MMLQKVGEGGMVKVRNRWVHNVSERQLEWGWPFLGQIRLVCQDWLEEKIEAVGTHTHKQATHYMHRVNTKKKYAELWTWTN